MNVIWQWQGYYLLNRGGLRRKRIQARPSSADQQAFHPLAVFQMRLQDLVQILLIHIGIPGIFGINGYHRTQLTAVETAGGINTHLALTGQACLLDLLFEVIAHGLGVVVGTAGAAIGAHIGTEEDVILVIAHDAEDTGEHYWLARAGMNRIIARQPD